MKSHENHRKPLILLNFFFQIALTSRSDRIFAQDFFSRSSTRVDLSISGKSLGPGAHISRRRHFEFIDPPSLTYFNNRLQIAMIPQIRSLDRVRGVSGHCWRVWVTLDPFRGSLVPKWLCCCMKHTQTHQTWWFEPPFRSQGANF